MKSELKDKLPTNFDNSDHNSCPVVNIWKILGRRWALQILYEMSFKERIRFNELKKSLSGISSNVLSERLSELEKEGLIMKKMFAEIPPRVEYNLTNQTKELKPILKDLSEWAMKWYNEKNSEQQPKIQLTK